MKIDKRVIVAHLRKQGAEDNAAEAESDLPDQVDTGHHATKLSDLGVHVQDLLSGGR